MQYDESRSTTAELNDVVEASLGDDHIVRITNEDVEQTSIPQQAQPNGMISGARSHPDVPSTFSAINAHEARVAAAHRAAPVEIISGQNIPHNNAENQAGNTTSIRDVTNGNTASNSTGSPQAPTSGQQMSNPMPAPTKPSPQAKPKVEVGYTLILSRTPIYEPKIFKLAGSLNEMSLQQLLGQLPFGADAEGLIFRLDGPGVKMTERISREDEAGFELMKRTLNKTIRVSLKNHASSIKTLVFEIEIEAWSEGVAVVADEDDNMNFI